MVCAGEAYRAAPTWPDAVHRGLVAHAGFLAAHPVIARLGFLEVFPAGPEAIKRLEAALWFFKAGLEQANEQTRRVKPVPPVAIEAIAGGLFELMRDVVLRRGPQELPAVVPDTTYAALAPFIGAKPAAIEAAQPVDS